MLEDEVNRRRSTPTEAIARDRQDQTVRWGVENAVFSGAGKENENVSAPLNEGIEIIKKGTLSEFQLGQGEFGRGN